MGSSNEHSAYGPVANPWDLETRAGRLQRRFRGGGRRLPRPALDRHRYRRLDPPARRADRHRRDEADLRPRLALRDRRVRHLASTRSGRSPATPATRPRCSTRSPAATSATPRPRRCRYRTSCSHLPASDDEAAAGLEGKRLGLPKEYFVAGHGARCRGAGSRRPSPRSRAPARPSRRSACRTPTTASRRTTSSPRPRRRRTSPATTASASGRGCGDGDVLGNYLATRGRGFGPEVKRRIMLGTYALSAGYYDAFYVKAQKVRTLIKRDFDTLFEQGFDALVAPTSPSVAFRFGAQDGRPGRDVPLRRLHAAREHGRPARRSRSRAACPRACRSGCS